MATEILAIPEEYLGQVIHVIRAGLENTDDIADNVRARLNEWCDDEAGYLERLNGE